MKRQILISSLILLFIQTLASAGVLYVPSRDYPTIQSAINDAVNGDVVVVAPGTWTGPGNVDLDFSQGLPLGQTRAITVRSEINPDNPEPGIIAATIIDCRGTRYNPHRAFTFDSGEGPNSKVLGFTIINGYAQGPVGAPGQPGYVGYPVGQFDPIDPGDPDNSPPRALPGADATTGDGYGGAILCAGASPTIQYCVISNCTVTGPQGGDGAPGLGGPWEHWTIADVDPCTGEIDDVNNEPTENTDGQWGGHGGFGSGNGYGGAISCRAGSSPIISDCTIKDNFATGGRGGNGGNGGYAAEFPDFDDGLESGSGNAGNSEGDGMGGGIYAENGSSPTVNNCTFSNNIATTGIRGTGGQRGLGNTYDDPPQPLDGFDSLVIPGGHIAGGAAYYSTGSYPNFTNCTFTGNKAYEAYTFYYSFLGEDISAYTVGGALYSVANNIITLDTCEFIGNLGGAVYCESGCNLNFDDCLFAGNSETANGGALYIGSGGTLDLQGCIFGGNSAYDDGGALKCRSNATLTNCSFGNNIADSDNDGWGYGGGVDVYRYNAPAPLTINVSNCSFTGNQSIYGGGFSSENFDATFTDCYFIGNTAQEGGGLDLVNGDVSVTGGVVKGNNATDGDGGGFNCSYSIAEIRDCTFSDNFADGIYPTGGNAGAINFYGGAPTQVVFNCLMTGNSATIDGGAVFCHNATPEIGNCTFSENLAGGYGGAIFSNWASDPQITDSIFQNNNSHAIYEQNFGGNAIVTYSLFYDNPDGDYYDSGTGLTYTGAGEISSIPGGSNNLYGDPLFESGPLSDFYLNQTLSPAVDNGSVTAVSLGLDSYTTDAANALDSGQVDIGYHYIDIADVDTFQLTTSVIGGQGTIEPETGSYYAGTVVTLTATPDPGWRIKAWSGTDDDSSTAETSSVVMNSDRVVTVEFDQPRTLIVAVGGGGQGYYSTIQDAVSDAEDGDTVVVHPGTYYGGYLGVMIYVDKSITIRSMHPDDPCYVAATIIDGYNGYQFNEGYNNTGVIFGPHTNANTILNGFTIQNCGGYYGTGDDGDRDAGHPDGYDGGSGEGPAITIYPGGGPVIKNCVIRDNLVLGGNAGAGEGATETLNAGRGGWAGWARGGAVYCAPNSSPAFINCQIIDNYAQGGNGGDGGDDAVPGGFPNYGGNWSMRGSPEYPVMDIDPFSLNINYIIDGHLWELWPWDFALGYFWTFGVGNGVNYIGDYRWYSGYGGGVFCDEGSTVTFTHCTISGNLAQGGVSGQGGIFTTSGRPIEPLIPYEIPSFGGGVYCAAEATITFTECTITDNTASEPNENNQHIDPYLGHGGGVCAEDTATVIFTNCTFSENEAAVGGGIHFADANPIISDCNFTFNSAFHGGGLFGDLGQATIIGCNIFNNEAVSDPNVVILGEGGGLHLWATEADIIDCNIISNQAEASGGGVFFGGEGAPSLTNCLLTKNTAGRDGGGVSTNIFTQLTISNCTIADNIVTGGGFDTIHGGGLYCSYDSYTNIINSIIWGNLAGRGSQIAIGTGFEYDQAPSTVNVSYSAIGPRYAYLGFSSDASFVGGSQQGGGGTTLVDGQTIYDQFDAGQDTVKVIVSLLEPVEMREATDWDSPESVSTLRAEIASRQSAVLSTLTPAEFTLRYRYDNQAGFSGEVTIEGFNKLLSNPSVAYIEPVRYVQPALAQAIPLANALEARQVYDGTGIAVAIVDSGVDYTHPRLGGGGFPNNKVIGGYDTGNNDNDPMPFDEAHGTCCAGIAAGNLGTVGDYIGGVAPSAKIYALKMTTDVGLWPTDSAVASWNWCVTHRNDDPDNPIKVMSNSWALWGVPFNDPVQADAVSPALTVAADSAVAAGITILAASGNDGFAGQGITWPSAMSKVISVGAVYDTTDAVTGYSNTADNLDILAPADPVYTTDIVGLGGYDPGDYFPNFNGTSSSCPFAAGAVASLQSAALAETETYLTPAQARILLVISGDPVTDTKVAITKPRVNLGMAINYLTAGPIYIEEGCQIEHGWWDPETQSWDTESHNLGIDDGPNFIFGYYLSQIAAGQLFDSPCVDTGSDLASILGLDTYTTRTDSVPDADFVDMGYHYAQFDEVPQYRLTIEVVDDGFDETDHSLFAVGGSETEPFTIEVIEGDSDSLLVNHYTTVELQAAPDSGWKVLKWTGTDDDTSIELNNTVTLDSDRMVTVEFEPDGLFILSTSVIGNGTIEPPGRTLWEPDTVVNLTATPDNPADAIIWTGTDDDYTISFTNTVTMTEHKEVSVRFYEPRTINVGGDWTAIQRAIDDANDGDIVIIEPGVYSYEPGQHPDGDILEIYGKAITLASANPDDPCVVAATVLQGRLVMSNVDRHTIIAGLTIQNPVLVEWFMGDPPPGAGNDGIPGIGYEGGGMMLVGSASPTVVNCVFDGCYVWGAHGSNGNGGVDARGSYGNGGWAGWARGGAVRVGDNGSPIFKNCSFVDCWAQGGDGGNGGEDPGGHGGNWSEKSQWDENSWIWDYGPFQPYWKYSGYGGAVYCNPYSSPEFVDCTFTNNHTYGGSCGISGQPYTSTWPLNHYKIDSFGGAVYAAQSSSPSFTGCVFTDNEADIVGPNSHVQDEEIPINYDPYISYGGAIAFEDGATPTFNNCTFNGNLATIGGGMWSAWAEPLVADCNFTLNLAFHGAGVYFVGASAEIARSNFSENEATFDINGVPPEVFEGDVAEGGAIYCFDINTIIADCNISDNDASGSGGGIYIAGSETVLVKNCLITDNVAGRDGGGISANWYSEPNITNCTIADNTVTGIGFGTSYGGGLYCSYDSYTNIINSIIWGNVAAEGSQIAVGSGDKYDPRPSTVNVTYSDIQPDADPNVPAVTALDIVFCIDTTGSMFGDIDAVKASAAEITGLIADRVPDFRIAVVDYRDFNESPYGFPDIDYPYNDVSQFTSDADAVVADIDTITLGAGADWEESVYAALMHCIDHNSLMATLGGELYGADPNSLGPGDWRTGAGVARAIILIGDAPPHDPEPFTEYTLDDVVAAANGKLINIFSIPVRGESTAVSYFTSLAEGTGGTMIEAASAGEVVGAIMAAIELITRAPPVFYVEEGCALYGWDWNPYDDTWDPNIASHNINEDPNFVKGYYLSHIATGQEVNSPCIDAGSDLAANLGLDTYTTRIDGFPDTYDPNNPDPCSIIVDMGYHYSQGVTQYQLTVTVVGGHGTVYPTSGTFYKGDVVLLTATPQSDPKYRVKKWTGTDDDTSVDPNNYVTMNSDKTVTVEFEPIPVYQLHLSVVGGNGALEPTDPEPIDSNSVTGIYTYYDRTVVTLTATPDPNYEVESWTGTDDDSSRDPNNTVTINGSDAYVTVTFGLVGEGNIFIERDPNTFFATIQDAIDAAGPFDVVVVGNGTYTGVGNRDLHFNGIPVTVRSTDPNGRIIPEDCIIDCEGAGRGFIFGSAAVDPTGVFDINSVEDPNYVVRGFTIQNGSADFGGGLYYEGFTFEAGAAAAIFPAPLVDNCIIIGNSATTGGGGVAFNVIVVTEVEVPEEPPVPTITNSKILYNTTSGPFGDGGGIFCTGGASPIFISTEISNNSSGDFGGGVYCEAESAPEFINCLVTYNSSADIGGAFYLYESPAVITLCTIMYNTGLDYEENAYGLPIPIGGVACRDTDPTISHCIIGRSGSTNPYYGTWGDGMTFGDDLYECEATFSCIENADDGEGNISDDPLFVTGGLGDFYLSQTQAGQALDSLCIDAGEQYILGDLQGPPPDGYNLDLDITTSIQNHYDIRFADMGYHYPFYYGPPIMYRLQISVSGNGTVTPAQGVYYYAPGTTVALNAVPADPTYGVIWSGTDNDQSPYNYNTVTMYSDRTVSISFELIVPRMLHVPDEYSTIQAAIDAARNGDIIELAATGSDQPYITSWGYDIIYKAITITSTNPDDPCCVANTVIEMDVGPEGSVGTAFSFSNVGRDTVLNGITIRGFNWEALDGLDGDPAEEPPYYDGMPGNWAYGGAIDCVLASPTIKNCVITDCNITGGDGGSGAGGDDGHPNGGNGGWPGGAYGGGVACLNNSSPLFLNCTFNNCAAVGGNAGDGGDGIDDPWGYGGRGGGYYYTTVPSPWEWELFGFDDYSDPGRYSGRGGAVYVGPGCAPEFRHCTFTNNQTVGGFNGICGLSGDPPALIAEPSLNWKIDNSGGAVYCDANSSAAFVDCTFSNNVADTTTDPANDDPYASYGGAVAFEKNANVTFENCTFNDNLACMGGGMYWSLADPLIEDCNFVGNSALHGGGVLFVDSSGQITRSNFSENEATVAFARGGGICCLSSDVLIADCNINHNDANGSGGGIYIKSDGNDVSDGNVTRVKNCLITNNLAARDGGGISVNWYAELIIANCTFVGNAAPGTLGEIGNTGFGGGLYCSYGSNSEVVDSIFWDNYAYEGGDQIAVGTGFEFDPRPATLTVTYSDVKDGWTGVQVDYDWQLNWGTGNINADPLFVAGPAGDYYLSQTDAGQAQNSPCVDAGGVYRFGMGYTTRTDEVPDRGIVDMGYHYPLAEPCRFCDLVYDGIINFKDFAILASRWLDQDCSDDNEWCDGADLISDGRVDFKDLLFFVQCWLEEDTTAPEPDPSEWKTLPYLKSATSISMTAKTAFDAWGWDVEYYFECVYGDCDDSGWQGSSTYTDTGLAAGAEYGYRVRAKDRSGEDPSRPYDPYDPNDPNTGNKTEWSVIGYVAVEDTTPPAPAPTWETVPYAISDGSISMVATTAYDDSGVEYYFEETSGNPGGSDSGWQNEPNYTDTGLDPNTTYTYRVRARDKTPQIPDDGTGEPGNKTAWSAPASATTSLPVDNTAPTPDPMLWAAGGEPEEIWGGPDDFYYAQMTAVVATDPSGVQYRFICTTNSGFSSGWQSSPTYTKLVGFPGQALMFYVIARDLSPNQNTTGPSSTVAAIPRP